MKKGFLEVGLTGGIASGKSTVSHFLSSLGIYVIDADEIAHQLIEPEGGAFDKVLERFGESIMESGRINRKKLADIVFKDRQALNDLNFIVHPLVREEISMLSDHYIAQRSDDQNANRIIVVEAALLVETRRHIQFDKLIVVHCSRETQIQRLMGRDGMSRMEAIGRINSQMPMEDKILYADCLINTDRSLEEVEKQTQNLHKKLLEYSDKANLFT